MGTANPIPTLPVPSVRMLVLIPITRPAASARAPPEFPGLIGASVCVIGLKPPLLFGTGRLRAETMPAVTVCWSWKGLPMATAVSPTVGPPSSASSATGRPAPAGISSTAMSLRGSLPMSRVSRVRPSEVRTEKLDPLAITWWFVIT